MIVQRLFRAVGTTRLRSVTIRSTSTKSSENEPRKSKISKWYRGYLGVSSNTEPPDAKFMAGNVKKSLLRRLIQKISKQNLTLLFVVLSLVATVVGGFGFYAWFIDPPKDR